MLLKFVYLWISHLKEKKNEYFKLKLIYSAIDTCQSLIPLLLWSPYLCLILSLRLFSLCWFFSLFATYRKNLEFYLRLITPYDFVYTVHCTVYMELIYLKLSHFTWQQGWIWSSLCLELLKEFHNGYFILAHTVINLDCNPTFIEDTPPHDFFTNGLVGCFWSMEKSWLHTS